jgi:hypothetical protein
MQGRDVLDLQRQLVGLGYGDDSLIDGVFGEGTEIEVRRFQTDYDILNDGVCGRVTQRVLKYLEENAIDQDNPPNLQQRHMISFIVKAQQGGLVVIDLISRSVRLGANRYASLIDSLIDDLGRRLESQLTALTGMQSWVFNSTDIITRDEEQLASFANNIKAELMITLSLADDPTAGPGCATFYLGNAPDVYSHVGRPLAACVQAEVVRVADTEDRGTHPEYSLLFERAQLPTIRVEFGNIAHDDDRERLLGGPYQDLLAAGIAAGIRKFYLFGQSDDDGTALNLGATSRR